MENEALILVFAKAPVPGYAKTRLIPACGAEQAALLHAALTERALETALASGAEVVLCCAPDTGHAFFQACGDDFDVALEPQIGADLGQRMLQALTDAQSDESPTLIIGADCPALTKKHLAAAVTALKDRDVVLIPAEDGGYVLIGARRIHPAMFDGIDWGTVDVLIQQRAALTRAGLTWKELEPLWDVDRPEDLGRLSSLKPPLAFSFAPTDAA